MRIAFVGCGFVADYYIATLPGHPELELIGVADRDPLALARFTGFHKVRGYRSLDELLGDDRVELVVNLTNPRSHFEVSKACLEAGKHVYSEKPLAMELRRRRPWSSSRRRGDCGCRRRRAACWARPHRPCGKHSASGRSAPSGWFTPRWTTAWCTGWPIGAGSAPRGHPWPAKDEFEVGCTYEHAGYYLTWLPAFFGPARMVTAFSSCLIPDKGTDFPLDHNAPDFSVACITFESGVVARLTCSLVAHTITHCGSSVTKAR